MTHAQQMLQIHPSSAAVDEATCRLCGDECERHASHHEHCRGCAEACRRCERACGELLSKL